MIEARGMIHVPMKRANKIFALICCFVLWPVGASEGLSQRRSRKRPKVTSPPPLPDPPRPSIEIIPGAKQMRGPYNLPREPKRPPPLKA